MEKGYNMSHTDALKITLDSFSGKEKRFYSEEDIENYILAFSFYLSAGDDAYHYHTDFLMRKHSDFRRFLRQAAKKQTQLNEFTKRIKQNEKIKQWRSSYPEQAKKVRVSVDDLFQSDLTGEVSICDKVSIKGAEWGKNIVTVYFDERTASFFYPASDRELEKAIDIFLLLVMDEKEREGEQ